MFQNASRSAEHDDGPSIPPELWKPEDLVDRRVDVHGLGRGLVVDFEKSPLFSDSLHTIEFDEGSEALEKQRREREKQILHEDSSHASDSSMAVDRHELQRAFTAASHHVHKIKAKLSTPQLLSLYALYKQTTHGDAPEAILDADEKQMVKWKAWNGARGLRGGEAAMQYVQLLASIDPPKEPGHSQLVATPGPSGESRRVQVLLRRKKMGRWNHGSHFTIVDPFVERLEAFYRHYAPQKRNQVKSLASHFRGREAELFTALQQKYGPDEQHPSGTPGGGGSAAATHRVTAAAREAAEYYQDLASRATENDAGVPSTPGRFDGDGTAHPGHEEEKKWAQEDDFAGHDEESASYSPSKSSASVRSSVQMVQHVGSVFGAAGDVLLDVALSADEEEIDMGSTEEVEVEDEEAGGQDDIGIHACAIIASTERNASFCASWFPFCSLVFVCTQVLVLVLIIV